MVHGNRKEKRHGTWCPRKQEKLIFYLDGPGGRAVVLNRIVQL